MLEYMAKQYPNTKYRLVFVSTGLESGYELVKTLDPQPGPKQIILDDVTAHKLQEKWDQTEEGTYHPRKLRNIVKLILVTV